MEVSQTPDILDENWYTLNFIQSYTNPFVMANLQAHDNGDVCVLRHDNLTSTSVDLLLEEEQSQDAEVAHTEEPGGYIVFEGLGAIRDNSGTVIGERGTTTITQSDANSWTTVNLFQSYNNPTVVAGPGHSIMQSHQQ